MACQTADYDRGWSVSIRLHLLQSAERRPGNYRTVVRRSQAVAGSFGRDSTCEIDPSTTACCRHCTASHTVTRTLTHNSPYRSNSAADNNHNNSYSYMLQILTLFINMQFSAYKSSNISETRQDRTKVTFVTIEDQQEVVDALSTVPISTSLDDFEGLLCSQFDLSWKYLPFLFCLLILFYWRHRHCLFL